MIVALVPPVAGAARRYDWAEALQFVVLALVVPALFVAGAPWDMIKLRRTDLGRLAEALAASRRRHPERLRSFGLVGAALACMITWRLPPVANWQRSQAWPLAIEVVSLLAAGVVLWLECMASPPLVPRATRPLRIALCALSMWTFWVLSYLVGMSKGGWYQAHQARSGLSLALDQQLTAGVMWAVAGACFIPLIFWNLVHWLHSEEDPDEELHRLVREERRRSFPPHPAP